MTTLVIDSPGPLSTIQDLGRAGYAHLGVPGSGAADRGSFRLANRLVGNPETAAGVEITVGGFAAHADAPLLVATAGATAVARVDGTPSGSHAAVTVPAGATLSIDPASWGCRIYLAVRGGIEVPPVLGSRSTDTLSEIGPPRLTAGTRLAIGTSGGDWPSTMLAPADTRHPDVTTLRVDDGPRRNHCAAPDDLMSGEWVVSPASDRVGLRLDRPTDTDPLLVHRPDVGELASEGIAHGSIQVPPSGRPVIFLADHPVTGGYPVIGVVTTASLDDAGQLVAGARIRFRPAR